MQKLLLCLLMLVMFINAEYYFEKGKRVELVKIDKSRSIDGRVETRYRNAAGRLIILQDKIIVKFKNEFDVESLISKYAVTIADSSVSNFLLLQVKEGADIFKISRELSKESFVDIAHPDFKRERRSR